MSASSAARRSSALRPAAGRSGAGRPAAAGAQPAAAAFQPDLPASQVHARLQAALQALRQAERNAVLWFAEIHRRRLYRDLGYSSMHRYAVQALGFSAGKASQFLRLSMSLERLPQLRASLASGELGWTKAREVARVATPASEGRWLAEAQRSSRRDLERKVSRVRARARAARVAPRGQGELGMPAGGGGKPGDGGRERGGGAAGAGSVGVAAAAAVPPQPVTLRFTAEEYARFASLLEQLWKVERRERGAAAAGRSELVLAGLAALLEEWRCGGGSGGEATAPDSAPAAGARVAGPTAGPGTAPCGEPGGPARGREFTRVNSTSPYQIVIYRCEACGRGEVVTDRGRLPLPRAALAAAACDARVVDPRGRTTAGGMRNRSTIPPGVRLGVLARDGWRCRAPGCGRTRFLEVHHVVPRSRGGGNDPGNLVTLCSACHRLLHERGERRAGTPEWVTRCLSAPPGHDTM
jgi:hypothetical protein